jgi:hypothetical protein
LEKEFYEMLEENLSFKLLFDIDISGTVESMYGSSEKERDNQRTIQKEKDTAGEEEEEDIDRRTTEDDHEKNYSSGRTCTSSTILHAYVMSDPL